MFAVGLLAAGSDGAIHPRNGRSGGVWPATTAEGLPADPLPPAVPSGDPRTVRTIAVTADDVVAALEANERGRRPDRTVLRITPPFSGRMRARIHVEQDIEYGDPAPVHVPPADLVADPPAFPTPDDTEDELRADPEVEYAPERHRRRHERAVEDWREAVRDSLVGTVDLRVGEDTHRVEVAVLG